MKNIHRIITLASIMALGLSSLSVPSQAAPVDVPSGSADVPTQSPDSTGSATIRLITGDIVHVSPDGDVTGVDVGPRSDGAVPQIATYKASSQTYVIPSDVRFMIGDQLDRELFNVSKLASYDLDDGAIPVIVAAADDLGLTPDVSDMGVDVTNTLDIASAQTGLADVSTDAGPAPVWGLLDQLDTMPTSAEDPVSSTTKVWLDQRYTMDLPPVEAANPDTSAPEWMTIIGASDAHMAGYTGEGVLVGVVDTGIDKNHPDLVGQVVAEQDFSGAGFPEDQMGHGTFVASEIAGTGAASNGVYMGVAPDAKLINARVLDDAGNGSDSGIIAGVEWAASQGADIINMSLGDKAVLDAGTSFMSQAINRISQQYGCLIVVAAGNNGAQQSVSSPGTADEALTVGATFQDGTLAWFSSTGPRRGDGAVKPEIMAPGVATAVLDENGNVADATGITGAEAGGQGYVSMMGTSMAAPLVAGAAALVKQSDPTLDRTEIRARLMASAQPLPISVFEQGAGLVNINQAIAQPVTTTPTQLNFGGFPLPYPGSATQTLTYTNHGPQPLTFDLTTELVFTQSLGLATISSDGEPELEAVRSDVIARAEASMSGQIDLSVDSLTIPVGGTALVNVTVDPSAFEDGYVGGYLIATSEDGTQLRTPIGWANEPQTYNLTITATDHTGAAFSDGESPVISVVNAATGETQEVNVTTPTVTVAVLPGDYAVIAYSLSQNYDGGYDQNMILSPLTTIASDTSITMDGTTAQPVTISTPQPAVVSSFAGVVKFQKPGSDARAEWQQGISVDALSSASVYITATTDPSWSVLASGMATASMVEVSLDDCGGTPMPLTIINSGLAAGQYEFALDDVVDGLASHADPGTVALIDWEGENLTTPTLSYLITDAQNAGYAAVIVDMDRASYWRNSLPDDHPGYPVFLTTRETGDRLRTSQHVNMLVRGQADYSYILTQEFYDLTQPLALVGDDQTTATVQIKHQGMEGMSWEDAYYSLPTQTAWMLGTTYYIQNVSSYTAYVTTGRFVRITADTGAQGHGTVTLKRDTVYEVGDTESVVFGTQVQSPGLTAVRGFIERVGDTVRGPVPLFIDGQGMPEVGRDSGFGLVDLTLTDVTTGTTLYDGHDVLSSFSAENLDPGSHTYQLDERTLSSVRTLSSDVTSRWTWQSEHTDESHQPLRDIWYELPGLDADNAGSEEQRIVVHSNQQINTDFLPIENIGLQASTDDGATWDEIDVHFVGTALNPDGWKDDDLYEGTIPGEAGQMVSLRSWVSGGGSSFDQTVMNAYTVTDSPRDYPAPVTWTCGGGGGEDTTAPEPPRVDVANASSVSGGLGAAEPGSIVTVVFPGGTTGTDVANGDGSYDVATPAGVTSGQVSVTATDAAGNVSDPTTAYLDTDRPEPARIDRADLAEVSGSVGAAEALSHVSVVFPDGSTETTQAQSDGSYSVPTPAGMVVGTVTVTVEDEAGNVSDPTTAQLVQPSSLTVSVRYASRDAGDTQSVTGTGFRSGERVTVSLCRPGGCSTVKTVLSTLSGNISTSFTIPKTAAAGTYTLALTGATSGSVSTTFDVLSPPSPQCWLQLVISIWLKLLGL